EARADRERAEAQHGGPAGPAERLAPAGRPPGIADDDRAIRGDRVRDGVLVATGMSPRANMPVGAVHANARCVPAPKTPPYPESVVPSPDIPKPKEPELMPGRSPRDIDPLPADQRKARGPCGVVQVPATVRPLMEIA